MIFRWLFQGRLLNPISTTVADIRDIFDNKNADEIEIANTYLTGLVDSAFHMNINYIGSDIQSGDYCFTGYYKSVSDTGHRVYKLRKMDSLNLATDIIKNSQSPNVLAAVEISSRLHSMFPCTNSTKNIIHKALNKYTIHTSSFFDTVKSLSEGNENTLEYLKAEAYISGIMEYAFVSEKGKRYFCWDLYFQSKDEKALFRKALLELARELIDNRLEFNNDNKNSSTAAVLLSEFPRKYACMKAW